MHRPFIIFATLLGLCVSAVAAEQSPSAQQSTPRDYKNRPDPCEAKQQKKPQTQKGTAGTAKPAGTQKP